MGKIYSSREASVEWLQSCFVSMVLLDLGFLFRPKVSTEYKSRWFGVNINLRNIGSSRNTGFLNDYVVHLWTISHLWRSLLCRNRLCYTKNRRWISSFGSCLWTNASIFICLGKSLRKYTSITLMTHKLWVITYVIYLAVYEYHGSSINVCILHHVCKIFYFNISF